MAIMEQYMTPDELQTVVALCKALGQFEQTIREKVTHVSTDIFNADDGAARTFKVYDSNGELLGHIGWGTGEYVFYFDDKAGE